MATVVRGSTDPYVEAVKAALDAYERENPGAAAELYRQNTASIRIRVVDDRFIGWPRPRRHDHVFDFLAARLDDDILQEVTMLLPLTRAERDASVRSPGSLLVDLEFDQPIPSGL